METRTKHLPLTNPFNKTTDQDFKIEKNVVFVTRNFIAVVLSIGEKNQAHHIVRLVNR